MQHLFHLQRTAIWQYISQIAGQVAKTGKPGIAPRTWPTPGVLLMGQGERLCGRPAIRLQHLLQTRLRPD
jgi:hypothetical protein